MFLSFILESPVWSTKLAVQLGTLLQQFGPQEGDLSTFCLAWSLFCPQLSILAIKEEAETWIYELLRKFSTHKKSGIYICSLRCTDCMDWPGPNSLNQILLNRNLPSILLNFGVIAWSGSYLPLIESKLLTGSCRGLIVGSPFTS